VILGSELSCAGEQGVITVYATLSTAQGVFGFILAIDVILVDREYQIRCIWCKDKPVERCELSRTPLFLYLGILRATHCPVVPTIPAMVY
jgi:hypothetical protein